MRKKITLSLAFVLLISMLSVSNPVMAQRHFYKRIELGASNVWGYFGTTLVGVMANHWTKMPLIESSLRFGFPSSEYGNLKDYNFSHQRDENGNLVDKGGYAKFNAKNVFGHVLAGGKMGYVSDYAGSLNYCLYGAAYYNLRQFNQLNDDISTRINTQRTQLGGGLILTFGSIEKNTRIIVDAGLRYNIPVYFSADGYDGGCNYNMNKGISSHYSVKYSYRGGFAVGLTLDMMHYDMFKNEDICGSSSKVYEAGISCIYFFDLYKSNSK